jgi:hypothetical protein
MAKTNIGSARMKSLSWASRGAFLSVEVAEG